jgi:Tfp pilus assembly protein PilP
MVPQAAKPMPAGARKVPANLPAAKIAAVPAKSAVASMKIVATPAKTSTITASKPANMIAGDEKIAPIDALKAPKPEAKKWAMTGKRDPFFSPVVMQTGGSGCSTGKKCLEIGQINVRGVVKSQDGFIAVVTNSMNKAYFLHENDPVFNGFVLKITGDSVVFQETYQDKLGKPLTREVTKRLTAPAV